MNIKPISKAVATKIDKALWDGNIEEARQITCRAWNRHLPCNGIQLTCNRNDIQTIFGYSLTERLEQADILNYYNSTDNQVIRRF